ncbi:MAG TPA: AMP-binding protein, partial [Candidatus Dormibacteraeota bacterium]|nr:AMP-binding protein [Candidatus Dormibacteraeota bacterium]
MATPSVQLDFSEIEQRVREVVGSLLAELGNERALAAIQKGSHLDRDLGLGSLERVELLVRLDATFHTRLADRILAEADTVADLQAAVSAAVSAQTASSKGPSVGFPTAKLPGVAGSREALGVRSAQTWQEVLRYRGSKDAQRIHIRVRNEDDSETSITFGELYERAEVIAGELARRGVAAGDRVAIMLPTAPEFFYTFAGALLAGAVPVPIYPPFRADRIEEYAERQSAILENAEARLLVTFREAEALARLLKPRIRSLAGVAEASRLAEPNRSSAPLPARPSRSRDDIALLQYTSGSTADPKGVVLTHANLLANVRAVGDAVQIRAEDVTVSWLPLYHDMGLIGAWLVPLYFGLPLSVLSPLAFLTRPERWLWTFHRCRGTLGAAPNFAFELCTRKIAEADIEGLDLSSIRALLNGAEPVHPATLERFHERFRRYGFRHDAMLPVYGLAEASLAVTIPSLGSPPRVDRIERDTFER